MTAQGTERRGPMGRYVPVVVGTLMAVAGILVDLYTEQARTVVESGLTRGFVRAGALIALVVTACVITWVTAERIGQRRRRPAVEARSFDIRNVDIHDDLPTGHPVVGRRLQYLERRTGSPYLVIFLPGLGLDASDFRSYMATAEQHTVSLTLFGLNVDEARDDRYRPIGIDVQAALVACLVRDLALNNERKRMILVGFSVGADMILKLGEVWRRYQDGAPPVHAALLLDPNINHTTMNISTAVAAMHTADPLAELKRLVQETTTLTEFQNVCEYLYKITRKDLEQVRRQAQDIVEYCGGDDTPNLFLQRVQNLSDLVGNVRVIFSSDYDEQFNGMVKAARQQGLPQAIFDATRLKHFQLMDDDLLPKEIAKLAAPPRRPSA